MKSITGSTARLLKAFHAVSKSTISTYVTPDLQELPELIKHILHELEASNPMTAESMEKVQPHQ